MPIHHPAPCYLDYNASAPLHPQVRAAMVESLALTGNPSSVHAFGRACRAAVEAARQAVAALVGARPAQVVFTSGGTEANQLALNGLATAATLVSAIEHDSVLAAAPAAARLPVDARGVIDLAALDAWLANAPAPALVSVMLANNETGVIQPVAEAAALVHRRNGLLHCDAIQAAGRLPLDCRALGCDLLSLSAHKLAGPAGVGALVVDERLALTPLLRGGGQERRRRSGTENLIGITGFGRAAALAPAGLGEMSRLAGWRDRLEQGVQTLAPMVQVIGAHAERVATTSCLALPPVAAETLVMALDLAGVAVGTGAACSSGKGHASHVLAAMGLAPAVVAVGAIRVSLGWATLESDIDRFLEAWNAIVRRLGKPLGVCGHTDSGPSSLPPPRPLNLPRREATPWSVALP